MYYYFNIRHMLISGIPQEKDKWEKKKKNMFKIDDIYFSLNSSIDHDSRKIPLMR